MPIPTPIPISRRTLLQTFIALAALAALAATPPAWSQSPAPPVPALLLANVYAGQIDPTLYLVSEKYDGVRAVWDGRTLRFRSGRSVAAPLWFTARLPAQPLDGELWLGRGRFEQLSGIVRKEQPVDEEWRQVHYMVFELPEGEGTFAQRALRIQSLVAQAGWPMLQAVEQSPVSDRASLQRLLTQIVAQGGEGLMLHLADAPYITGRSDVLLKLKPYLDTEAIVVAHLPGKGKYSGQMGALRLQMPDGRRFNLGTGFSDAERREPPALGSSVTYRYRDLTSNGLPRFASFLRVRAEL